jgi:predicted membrane protein
MTHSKTQRSTSSLLFGSLLTLFGVVLLLDNLGYIDANDILRFWPIVLVLIGAFRVVRSEDTGGKVVGLMIAIVGLWLLLTNFEVISLSFSSLWPLLLIGLGILLLVRASRADLPVAGDGGETLNAFALLGGVNRTGASKDFRGGKLTAIMGGCQIDLRNAEMKADSAVIDVFALWGGIELTVPSGWTVESTVTPILGGVEDKTAHPPAGGRKLVVTGTVVMGGLELKS